MRQTFFCLPLVIALSLASGCATQTATSTDLSDSKIYNVQPINQKEACLMPGHVLMKAPNAKRLWDGDCKEGFASGYGRDMILTDDVHFEHFHYLDHRSPITEAPYAWYYMHDEKNAVGVMRHIEGNNVFSGSVCFAQGQNVDGSMIDENYATGEWHITEPKSSAVFVTEKGVTTMRSNAMPKGVVLMQMTNGVYRNLTESDYNNLDEKVTEAIEYKLKLAAPIAFEARKDATLASDFISTYKRELCKKLNNHVPAGVDATHYLEICQ